MKSQGDPTKACFNAAGFENFHGKKMFGICHAQAMAPSYTWKISPPLPRIGHPSLQQCATMRSQESTSWANLKGEAGEAHQGSNFDLTRTSIYFSATFPTSTLFLTSNIWDRGLPDVWFVVLVSIPFSLLDHLSLFDSLLDLFGLMKVCQASVASCSPLFSSKFPPPSPHHPRKQRPRTSHCSPAVQALATADLALRIAMEASLGEQNLCENRKTRETRAGMLFFWPSSEQACRFPLWINVTLPCLTLRGKKGGPENPKARQRTARFF